MAGNYYISYRFFSAVLLLGLFLRGICSHLLIRHRGVRRVMREISPAVHRRKRGPQFPVPRETTP